MELFNLPVWWDPLVLKQPELVPPVRINWGGPKLPDNLMELEVKRAGLALCLGVLQDQCEIPIGLTLLILINKKISYSPMKLR